MNKKGLRIPDYIEHIINAIKRIKRYTENMDKAVFLDNEMAQDATIRNIEIIGEAANNIRRVFPEFASLHRDIPWRVMYTMRNRVSHKYEDVDLEIVWETIVCDLPVLYQKVQKVAQSLSHDENISQYFKSGSHADEGFKMR